jgi:sulfate adenylyltransferase subunit 1
VKDIVCLDRSLPVAVAGDSVTLTLADDIDISRGDLLAKPTLPPRAAKAIEARICWLSAQPLDARALPAARFVLKHTTRSVKARLVSLNSRVDVDTLERQAKPAGLAMNDIAHVALALAQPLFVDSYDLNRATGSFILIDEVSNQTVAAGMIDG